MKTMRNYMILAMLAIGPALMAQCDEIAKKCGENISDEFMSDGQSYRAFLVEEETAEFRTTLFEGTDYRIAACAGMEKGALKFRLLDENRNVLYSNEDYDLISYWNFRASHTTDCIIEAVLNPEVADSGCATMLISFKR